MFRIAAPAAHHIFPLMDPLPPLAEQLLGAEINKIPHTLVCGILVREAGLEPARPEWTLEPESHYGLPPSVGAGLAIANPFASAHVSPLLFSFDADHCVI